MTSLITTGRNRTGETFMGKQSDKCCKKYKEGKRCKSCPRKKGK
jgi:hypothetical protein